MIRSVETLDTHPIGAMLAANPKTAEDASELFYALVLDQLERWLQHHEPTEAFVRVLKRTAPGLWAATATH